MDDPPTAPLQITFVGTGPVGTSLALAWKGARPALVVTGLDDPDALESADAAGALDRKAAAPEAALENADLVVLSERLPAALRRLEELAPHLSRGTLVTDTGAAKQPIDRHAAEVLHEGVSFVGGHPVPAALPEEHATAADPDRFDGGTYFLCPSETEDHPPDLETLRARHPEFLALVETTGARPQVLSAARHDRLCATARDLPAVLSAALAGVVSEEGDHEALHTLMPPALRPLVWGRTPPTGTQREELVAREGALLDALGRYVRALQEARRHLAAGDHDAALGTEDEE